MKQKILQYWLVKSDPSEYSFHDLVRDTSTLWTGVRNFQARNNLQLMNLGDYVLVYHSQEEKTVVGIAKVTSTATPDPTIHENTTWIAVKLEAVSYLASPVHLHQIKLNDALQNIALIKQSRLSVMPLTEGEYTELINLSSK